jgi:hypothetical protein
MGKKIFPIGIFCLAFLLIQSCKKAGTDGEATLSVFPKHHGVAIPSITGYPDSVYVKFNAEDLPSDPTHNYDVVYVGVVGDTPVNCTTLHAGKYYLFATGWDVPMNHRVSGGMAVKIKYGDRKKAVIINVPVTE